MNRETPKVDASTQQKSSADEETPKTSHEETPKPTSEGWIRSPVPQITPHGSQEWVPICSEDLKPAVGMTFKNLEDGIKFYESYAKVCGFDTRRYGQKKKQGAIKFKYIVCNKFGEFQKIDNQKNKSGIKRNRTVSRVGCKASMGLKLNDNGEYQVMNLHEGHKHELASPADRQFLKSYRNMTILHKKIVLDHSLVNKGPTQAHKISKNFFGGFENVKATLNDYKNFYRDLKMYIGDADANMFINNFAKKKENWDGFFYKYDVDKNNTLIRAIWADPISRKNYALYGDMVSFDTTYQTNKYNLIFAPFTGVNNHKKCVTFASGFLANEDKESFVWLFKAFLECMGGCHPKCIVTDMDPAMRIAIPEVFHESTHRFCMWHIMKKMKEKVADDVDNQEEFLSKISKVVWDRDTDPEEFEEGWKQVIEEFGLEDNDWLNDMYNLKESWIPSYFKDLFMGAILRTSQISECENNFFTQFTNPFLTLVEFWLRYENSLESQRNTQQQLDTSNKNSWPQLTTELDLEQNASQVYTHKMFYIFQDELDAALFHCTVRKLIPKKSVEFWTVHDNKRKRDYDVQYNTDTNVGSCYCKMFEREGMLCRHMLYVMKGKELEEIPQHYVVHRWTKKAPKKPVFDFEGTLLQQCDNYDQNKNVLNSLWSKIFNCVTVAEQQQNGLQVLLEKMSNIERELTEGTPNQRGVTKEDQIKSFLNCSKTDGVDINIPNQSTNKGRKRLISQRDKAKMKVQVKYIPRGRSCKTCGEENVNHDSRNCPELKEKKKRKPGDKRKKRKQE